MTKVQLLFFWAAGLLVALGLGLSACRAIVKPPPLPGEIVPVLVPDGADRGNGIDE